MHVHYLPHLSLSFARHTDALNQKFVLLSTDYSKSLHLQTDRFLQFHTPQGCHYSTRIPRYGRDLVYNRRSTEAIIPSVGVNADGSGEVFRLNLEVGRFMKGFEVDVGGDDFTTLGGGALQGGVHAGSVDTASIAEQSHNLMAFGTSIGTTEFWDPRSKNRIGILHLPLDQLGDNERHGVSAVQFHRSGLEIAMGTSNGLIYLYDLRSPVPLLKKDQGYGYPIQDIIYLNSSIHTQNQSTEPKILSSDKRIIKIWDATNGAPWTSVEPTVDLNQVTWCPDSGMLLTANEGRQQHAFFIPQLGPAPKWCSFLDNLVEEMAEDPNDPNAFASQKTGEVYDNYKFLTVPQIRALNLDHLIGTTSLFRPYMHGYFVTQSLYEEARLISKPEIWEERKMKSIQEKIDKERESRIRGNKSLSVKVNRKLAQRILEREEKQERRRARRIIEQGGDDDMVNGNKDVVGEPEQPQEGQISSQPQPDSERGLLKDPRFAQLFQDDEFEVDESSREFQAINPSTTVSSKIPKGLTAVEEEELESSRASSSDESSSEADGKVEPTNKARSDGRISSSSYKKSARAAPGPKMVESTSRKNMRPQKDLSLIHI